MIQGQERLVFVIRSEVLSVQWLAVGVEYLGFRVEAEGVSRSPPGTPETSLPASYIVSSNRSGPVDPSSRALSGRLQCMVRRHKFNTDSLSVTACFTALGFGGWGFGL